MTGTVGKCAGRLPICGATVNGWRSFRSAGNGSRGGMTGAWFAESTTRSTGCAGTWRVIAEICAGTEKIGAGTEISAGSALCLPHKGHSQALNAQEAHPAPGGPPARRTRFRVPDKLRGLPPDRPENGRWTGKPALSGARSRAKAATARQKTGSD